MHELSVALSIVEASLMEIKKAGAKQVDRIELEIGKLAGIEFDALDFVWPEAVAGTALEKAKKDVLKIDGKAKCHDCQCEFVLQDVYEACPNCNGYFKDLIQGKELKIKSLEVS